MSSTCHFVDKFPVNESEKINSNNVRQIGLKTEVSKLHVYIFGITYADGKKRFAMRIDKKIFSYISVPNLIRQLVKKEDRFFSKKNVGRISCFQKNSEIGKRFSENEVRVVCHEITSVDREIFYRLYKKARQK